MGKSPKLCLLGQVCVDVTLGNAVEQIKLRLGGIFHAARALWAIGVPYEMAYIAPDYLTRQIEEYAYHHGATAATRVGTVNGSPNVILIREATEAGPQGYEFLLRDEHQSALDSARLGKVAGRKTTTDVVIFPGGFDLTSILKSLASSRARIHIDISYGVEEITELAGLGRRFDVISLSTSSELFLRRYQGEVRRLCSELLKNAGHALLFKENRGGARFFTQDSIENPLKVYAHVRPIAHSVGVGDCFDVVFAAQRHRVADNAALAYASIIAAEYAATTFPDDFKEGAGRALSVPPNVISQIHGVSLPWESRPSRHIYVAAPDFDYVDRFPIDRLVEALKYHNFTPRLPVREHGQMGRGASKARKQRLCGSDLRLLNECSLVVAVLIGSDPGTLIEIGIAVERGMPVVVYDPYEQAENLMLTELPSLVSASLDEVVSAVFKHVAELATDE